jgi:hypothetical protein
MNQLNFYKINGSGYNPDPSLGHAGIPAAPTRDAAGYVQYYNNPASVAPTGLEWVLGSYGATGYYAEYEVDRFSGGGGGGNPTGNGAFPIEWLDFTGRKHGNEHILEWHTARETGSDYFEVQRMTNHNLGVYERIGMVKAAGNTNEITGYDFVDDAPIEGSNLYRLKQIDIDGSFAFSKSIELIHEVGTYFELYPNPFENLLQVKVDGITQGVTSFELYDMAGRLVLSEKWDISTVTTKSLDVSQLAVGTYNYVLRNGKHEQKGKAIKSK